MLSQVLITIKTLLEENQIAYHSLEHEATPTSEDSARVRGEPLNIGGKALVLKTGDDFNLFVLSASRKLDSKAIKKYFGVKKVRFATKEELLDLTGLIPGAVPPFGPPILKLPLYLDSSILQNTKIAFNAGSLTDSIIMQVEDYVRLAAPEVFTFSQERQQQ